MDPNTIGIAAICVTIITCTVCGSLWIGTKFGIVETKVDAVVTTLETTIIKLDDHASECNKERVELLTKQDQNEKDINILQKRTHKLELGKQG